MTPRAEGEAVGAQTADLPLYVACPRCKGDRMVFAITQPGNDFFPSRGEYFDCPLCHATGEADREHAEEWTADHEEDPAR